MSDYTKARQIGLTNYDRWEDEAEHHPMSVRLMSFLMEHDSKDYDGYFRWKRGGDGDNGEELMYQMDAFFEYLDRSKNC